MKRRKFLYRGFVLSAALSVVAIVSAQGVTINVDAGNRGAKISDRHYGIFFEEINHAGEGGLYAELVKNRSFETGIDGWSVDGTALAKLIDTGLLNKTQRRALQLTIKKEGDGIRNTGYWGMNMVKDREYNLAFWMKKGDYTGDITAVLKSSSSEEIGSAMPEKIQEGSDGWSKYAVKIVAMADDPKGTLVLRGSKAGVVILDEVSLFPPTFRNRENGCREDLAQMLADMKPKFMRFPGGCFVEGGERFEWKKTIGPVEERPGHTAHWGYHVSDGFGFHEMLQLAEDLGAEPLFVVNIGLGHGWSVDHNEIGSFIQEALDAIEYCNGDASTEWGAKRIANGHPEPFNLQLIEIGNENYQRAESEQSDHYAERYKQFHDAIRARYPEMILIGNVESWGTDDPTWRNPYPVDVLDEHYYRNPAWFANQYDKYDSYDRSGAKIYAGEYAVTSDFGKNGNLTAALGEAVYMLGMERNSDVVVMNSYAPIFVNENAVNWQPDMIRFNSSAAVGTPSYHVQKLMACNVGKQNVHWIEEGNLGAASKKVGLSTWSTSAVFDNVKVTDTTGKVLFSDDFSAEDGLWSAPGAGNWSISGGVLTQADQNMQGAVYVCNADLPDSYILELEATKTGGAEGFLIAFNYDDDKNYCWWNLGGWGNTNHAIEVCNNGSKTTLGQTGGSLENGHNYKIRIEVDGIKVRCYLDGNLVHSVNLPLQRKVYVASSIDDDSKTLYLKLVNVSSDAVPATINMAGAEITGCSASLLTSASGLDENSLDSPDKVIPQEVSPEISSSTRLNYTVPAYSLTILRLSLDNIDGPAPGNATESEIAQVREDLGMPMSRFNFLHSSAQLPICTKGGATIRWSLNENHAESVDLADTGMHQILEVVSQPDKLTRAAILTASVTFPNGHTADIDYEVNLAPRDEEVGYLYCFMNAVDEVTNFALGSKEDLGSTFEVLLNGDEVFDTKKLAGIEGGTRDPYIARGQRADEYFMTTTDMKQSVSNVWSNYGINLLRSSDMIHWESTTFDFRKGRSIFSDPDADDAAYKTDEEYARIHRVWAPQFIWDPDKNMYLVYYSLLSSNPGDYLDRIYYSYADPDFKTLTQPRVLFSRPFSTIDADIVYNPYTRLYHLLYKWEGAQGNDRGLYIAVSDHLTGSEWRDVLHITNEGTELIEGGTLMRRINEDAYNLYYMQYTGGVGYKMSSMNHAMMSPAGSADVRGSGAFQHGSVFPVSEDEYITLQFWSDLMALLSQAKSMKENTGTTIFDDAITMAEKALAGRSVADLSKSLPEAVMVLRDAHSKYVASTLDPDKENDITSLLVNPDFSQGQTGWSGTVFTAAPGNVAEHFNKTFDTYQVLDPMPAGVYRMEIQGFYRCGSIENAKTVHANGTEALNAEFYLNQTSAPFMSIYDESAPYTMTPYRYPDNVAGANAAFNTDNSYNNSLQMTMPESGALRIGIRKNAMVNADWNCFDNVRLYYVTSDISGIKEITGSDSTVDVYTPTGILVRRGADSADPVAGLAPGIYIAGGRKLLVSRR